MRKRIKEVVRLIIGSALIGMSAVIILGGAICGLCKGSYPESMTFWLFTMFFLNFALFLGTSLIYACNKEMWDQVYDSDGSLQKLLPNLRIFYEFVMFMSVI